MNTLRRRRVAAGIALLAVAAWLAAGLRRTADDGRAAVVDSRLGLIAPRRVPPGWHLVPPGLLRLTRYPLRSRTLVVGPGGGGERLVTREGSEVDAEVTLRYRVEADRVLEVHRTLGPRFEDEALRRWTHEALRDALSEARYADVSGARTEALQAELSRVLGERFRSAGLVLLSCEVGGVRLHRALAPGGEDLRAAATGRVLVIGLDGADWNIVDPLLKAGRMPHLARLVRRGVRARMRTITPMLSPVIWTSMATGVVPARHGILDFVARTNRPGERVPVSSTQRRVKAIWNILSESGVRVGVVGWWATWPAESVDGFMVSDRVAYQLFGARSVAGRDRTGKVYPPEADPLVVSLTVSPESIGPRDLQPFMRLPAGGADLPAAEMHLVDDFKTLLASSRTYVAATLALAARYHPDFATVYLEGTDTVAHLFMPYAPPLLQGIDREAARHFGGVVDAYYASVDGMIGRLIEGLHPVTVIVVSDHGFRTGANRPLTDSRIGYGGAADWHRKYGILVMSGPPFREGVSIEEASVLDLTPTLLRIYGLPVGEDMDGRPIVEAFSPEWLRTHPEKYIPSWETRGPRPRGSQVAAASPDAEGDAERLQRLRDLGYLAGGSTPASAAAGAEASGPDGGAARTGTGGPAGTGTGGPALTGTGGAAPPGPAPAETANAHNNRGTILLSERRYDEAIGEFEKAMAASEDLTIARLNLARAYFKKKDYEKAVRILHEHLERKPRSKEAENLLGNIAMEQGDLAGAEEHFRKALSWEPNFTDARNSLGLLFEREGRHEDALAEFRRVVAVDSDYAEAYNNIGVILKNTGRTDEAVAAFRRAIQADPEFAGSYSNLALIEEERGRPAEAEQQFRSALRRDPDNAAVRTNFGGLLYSLGRLDEARRELEKAVATDPSYASAYNNLGAVLGKLGRADDEIAAYRRAVALDPGSADVHHNLGLALMKAGRDEEGEKEMRRSLEADRRYAPAYENLARFLVSRGRLQEAIELLAAGAREIPKDADLEALHAEALARAGRTEEAVAALRRALTLRPGDAGMEKRLEALESSPGKAPE